VEYEPLILPEENNSAFPGHVTEDSLGVSQMAIDIDSALEAVEGKFPYYLLHILLLLCGSSRRDIVFGLASTR